MCFCVVVASEESSGYGQEGQYEPARLGALFVPSEGVSAGPGRAIRGSGGDGPAPRC